MGVGMKDADSPFELLDPFPSCFVLEWAKRIFDVTTDVVKDSERFDVRTYELHEGSEKRYCVEVWFSGAIHIGEEERDVVVADQSDDSSPIEPISNCLSSFSRSFEIGSTRGFSRPLAFLLQSVVFSFCLLDEILRNFCEGRRRAKVRSGMSSSEVSPFEVGVDGKNEDPVRVVSPDSFAKSAEAFRAATFQPG